MTINKLYELLHHLVVTGHGRMHVCIDKATFHHNCEGDGVTILEIEQAELRTHWLDDGDGSAIINRDGSERVRTALVLDGGFALTVRPNDVQG